jgi:hypothetical protein
VRDSIMCKEGKRKLKRRVSGKVFAQDCSIV